MKRILPILILTLGLLAPATAVAKHKGPVYVPPNQSAASQYTEDVPTAGGNTPTSNVHHTTPPGGGSGGSHGGGGSTGSGSGHTGGGPSASSSISSSTLNAMSHSGAAGAGAASIAQALAPTGAGTGTRSRATQHTGPGQSLHTTSSAAPLAHVQPSSAAGQVIKTLAGSDAGSGIGALLPVILIASLVFATGLGIARFRRPGAAS